MAKEMRQDPVLGGWHEVEVENKKMERSDRYLFMAICGLLIAGIANFFGDLARHRKITAIENHLGIPNQEPEKTNQEKLDQLQDLRSLKYQLQQEKENSAFWKIKYLELYDQLPKEKKK